MSEPMTKEQFVRKMFGHKQTQKNNYIKTLTNNTDVDTFLYDTSSRIRKQKHIKW